MIEISEIEIKTVYGGQEQGPAQSILAQDSAFARGYEEGCKNGCKWGHSPTEYGKCVDDCSKQASIPWGTYFVVGGLY